MLSNSPYLDPQYYPQEQQQYFHAKPYARGCEIPPSFSSTYQPGFSSITPLRQSQQRSFAGYSTASSRGDTFAPYSSQNTQPVREERFIQGTSQYSRGSPMMYEEMSTSEWYPAGRREIIIENNAIPVTISNNLQSERVIIERPLTFVAQERFIPTSNIPPPPPMVPSQRILTPSVPVVSWHPLSVSKQGLNSQQKQQNQQKQKQENSIQKIEENEEESTNQVVSSSNISKSNLSNNSTNQLKSTSELQSSHYHINNSSNHDTDNDDSDEENSRNNRFEELFQFERINQKHENLFQKEFRKDHKMKDVFRQQGDTAQFDLGNNKNQIVPSRIWRNIDNRGQHNLHRDDQSDDDNNISLDSFEEYETITTTTMRNQLWAVRYNKINEADYLVSTSHNMFARKSNYLRLGLFYKQAFIKYQFDKKKDICYYMYSYDEYSVKKKQSEIDQEAEQQELHIPSLSQFDDHTGNSFDDPTSINDFNDKPPPFQANSSKIALPQQQQSSKPNLGTNKSIVWTLASKQNVLNQSNSQLSNPLKSKVITMTTLNKSLTIKTKVQDQIDFTKSSFMRDYEHTYLQNQSNIAEENESKLLNKSLNSSSEQQIDISKNSENYLKLFKSKPAKQRKNVIEKKQDDLSKIKSRHNKFELWEKNAVSEDAFLDQVRDSTIEAVRRARNLEQIIVEKNSVFEHHAASLLHQHVFQLRKATREYKAQLYGKVKEIIQFIYDEYREAINFESNNTFVMLVCDRADSDRILGVHYHGYQSRRYFEKHFDEFVTYSKTKQEFEEKRYQALPLTDDEIKVCKRYFMKE